MTVSSFPEVGASQFPAFLKEAIDRHDWGAVEKAIEEGVRPELYSKQEVASVVEYTMRMASSAVEAPEKQALPVSLLEAFCRHGLSPGHMENGLGIVARAAQHGQWAWVTHLLDAGWSVEEPDAQRGTLWTFMRGQGMRHQLASFSFLAQAVFSRLDGLVEEDHPQPNPEHDDLPANVRVLPVPSKMADSLSEKADDFLENMAEGLAKNLKRAREQSVEALEIFQRLLVEGADVNRLDSGLKWSDAGQYTPLEQALSMGEDRWVNALLDGPGTKAEVTSNTLLVATASACGKNPQVFERLVHRLPEATREQAVTDAAFEAVRLRRSSFVGLLQYLPQGAVDKEGWTLLQRAAEAGNQPLLEVLVALGGNLDQSVEVGPSPADLLRLHHPALALQLGVTLPEESSAVRVLRPRR